MWKVIIVVSLFDIAFLQSNRELIPFEPIQYIKSQCSMNRSSVWDQFLEATPQKIAEISSKIKVHLHTLQGSETNVIFARGERIINKILSSKSVADTVRKVPYANLIPLFSISMTIVLEGFQSKLITRPIGEIFKEKDLLNHAIQEYTSFSLLEVLCMLSSQYSETDSDIQLEDLNNNGKAIFFFVDSILGNSAKEAWMDALMAFNIEDFFGDTLQLKLSLHDLLQFVLTVIHDFQMMDEVGDFSLPLQNQHYLFGWWLNCPNKKDCLFSHLPHDLIFSVSSSLRIYISPTLELSLLVSDFNSNMKSFNDVLKADMIIWDKVYSVLHEEETEEVEDGITSASSSTLENKTTTQEIIHQAWPIIVFVFWVVSSHVWVYWMFHCCWLVAISVSKRTHIFRPIKAAN